MFNADNWGDGNYFNNNLICLKLMKIDFSEFPEVIINSYCNFIQQENIVLEIGLSQSIYLPKILKIFNPKNKPYFSQEIIRPYVEWYKSPVNARNAYNKILSIAKSKDLSFEIYQEIILYLLCDAVFDNICKDYLEDKIKGLDYSKVKFKAELFN